MKNLDAPINELFRKMDTMKAQEQDGTPEYMALLYECRRLCNERVGQ